MSDDTPVCDNCQYSWEAAGKLWCRHVGGTTAHPARSPERMVEVRGHDCCTGFDWRHDEPGKRVS